MRMAHRHKETKAQAVGWGSTPRVATMFHQPSSNQRERVLGKRSRRTSPAIAGFSLIELLFAVLVLSMGMIFVAMQFPVGLANSRKQTDETMKLINTHNAKVTMELQLGAVVNSGIFIVNTNTTPGGYDDLIVADGNVHLLPKVNLLNDLTLVIDDPEDMLDLGATQDYGNTSFNTLIPADFFPPYITIDDNDELKLGNLGQIMSPAVTSSDVDVVNIVGTNYNPTNDDPPNYPAMNAAIFDVALTRIYNWCALYKAIDQNTIRFYIFTIRKGKHMFAMQDDATLDTPEIFDIRDPDEDRMYPVPWRVDLNDSGGTSGIGNAERNFIGTGTKNAPQFSAPDEFLLDTNIADLFQEGTVFVDADSEDDPIVTDWEDNGYVYEVMEVTRAASGAYFLRLQKPLEDDLNIIWIIPPAVIGGALSDPEFSEANPVMDVAEQVIRF